MLVEEELRVDFTLDKDFLDTFYDFLSADAGKLVDKFVKVNRVRAVDVQMPEKSLALIVFKRNVHPAHLVAELREADLIVRVCVHDGEHDAEVDVLGQNVFFNFLPRNLVFLLIICVFHTISNAILEKSGWMINLRVGDHGAWFFNTSRLSGSHIKAEVGFKLRELSQYPSLVGQQLVGSADQVEHFFEVWVAHANLSDKQRSLESINIEEPVFVVVLPLHTLDYNFSVALNSSMEAYDSTALTDSCLLCSVHGLIKSVQIDHLVDFQVLYNFESVLLVDTLSSEDRLQLSRPYSVESASWRGLPHDFILGSCKYCVRQDLVNYILLDTHHVDCAILTHRLAPSHSVTGECLVNWDLVKSLVSCGSDRTSEDVDEVIFLNHVWISHIVVAPQENVELTLLESVTQQSQTVQTSVFEVFLGTVALPLGENTKHELNFTVKRG